MTLKAIFYKPVDRPIEGVIKADDAASLHLEVEEYVLTNEVAKCLEAFLRAYNNYEGANGVWISGFFGSGKSHLLKMLALLLENRQIDGVASLDLFLPKCGDNEFLRADLKQAVGIPSKSILFNIDQKADVISKTQVDALLSVFVKVFDEMCGYYGKQGHIAQFERDLDSRGLYTQFKTNYESTAGRTWEKGREQGLLETGNIAKAYAQTTGDNETSAIGILDKYRSEYRVSIEDFAEKVHAYIEKQSPDFRLNFFVDEVGQYIAENVKLMTNMQTIAESLATRCRGRAWIMVTAQEDMEMVVGEMGKQQGNDFSKIQARFANRMKLTSADVEEVIQERLLKKKEAADGPLSDIYLAQTNNFKTLFDFADGSKIYRNFRDRDHFIHSYPFIPYQFALFQSAIQNLSQHEAFEGKHSSVGERSMLGVFQQVAIQISNHEIGLLATFDLMFEGIRTALKSGIQQAIIQTENHLNNPFALRLLKTLFLVKYVKEFKATTRNLCVLMLDGFDLDISALKKQVEDALNLLEQQTCIQRSGAFYSYLTDEEKDVEQEIKNTEVEDADVAAELAVIVFDQVIKHKKIRCEDSPYNRQDYPYSRKLDDRMLGREQELVIHVISPFNENVDNEQNLQTQSLGRDELLVLMPPDNSLVRDLLMYKKTEKYILQNNSTTQQETVKRILNDKGTYNQQRHGELRQQVINLLRSASLFVAGSKLDISVGDAQNRIIEGFQDLVIRTYPNLQMLRGINYVEDDIAKFLSRSGDGLFGDDAALLTESENELLAHIKRNEDQGVRTTLKNLLEKFECKPYGWSYAAVLCTIAKLCARGKIEIMADSNSLDGDKLEQALRNTRGHGNIVLVPQLEFSQAQLRTFIEFYENFLDKLPHANEAKALVQEFKDAMQVLINQVSLLADESSQYPFLNALTPILENLKELNGRSYPWYLTDFVNQRATLLEMKVSIIDPVRAFMTGSQKAIFDNARQFVQAQEFNFTYIEDDTSAQIQRSLNDADCYKSNRMQEVKTQVEILQELVAKQVDEERMRAKADLATLMKRLCAIPEFSKLNKEQQERITLPFDEFTASIEHEELIAVIHDSLNRFEENDYPQLLSQLTARAQSVPVTETVSDSDNLKTTDEAPSMPNIAEPCIEYVLSRAIRVPFGKPWLADKGDVDRYLESMREALLTEINKGKRIQI